MKSTRIMRRNCNIHLKLQGILINQLWFIFERRIKENVTTDNHRVPQGND